jgi:hypothetical protein
MTSEFQKFSKSLTCREYSMKLSIIHFSFSKKFFILWPYVFVSQVRKLFPEFQALVESWQNFLSSRIKRCHRCKKSFLQVWRFFTPFLVQTESSKVAKTLKWFFSIAFLSVFIVAVLFSSCCCLLSFGIYIGLTIEIIHLHKSQIVQFFGQFSAADLAATFQLMYSYTTTEFKYTMISLVNFNFLILQSKTP